MCRRAQKPLRAPEIKKIGRSLECRFEWLSRASWSGFAANRGSFGFYLNEDVRVGVQHHFDGAMEQLQKLSAERHLIA